jgi:hypothetical protein
VQADLAIKTKGRGSLLHVAAPEGVALGERALPHEDLLAVPAQRVGGGVRRGIRRQVKASPLEVVVRLAAIRSGPGVASLTTRRRSSSTATYPTRKQVQRASRRAS